MNYKIIKNITIVLLVVNLLISCNEKKNKGQEIRIDNETESVSTQTITFSEQQYRLAAIETGNIEKRAISNIIKLNGKIEVDPSNTAVVSAQLGGYIKTSGLIIGTPVKKGQLLATLENVEFITIQQNYLESVSELEFVTKEYERQKELRAQDINAKKTYQKITSQYKMLQAKVNALSQKLGLIGIDKNKVKEGIVSRTANLYAPIDGYIKTSNAIIGGYVTPRDIIFEIVNTEKVHLELNVYESMMSALSVGQKVRFSLANETDFNRIAIIEQIGKASGNERVIIVHCDIDEKNLNGLLPEMYVKAWVESNTSNEQVVPSKAIVTFEGVDYLIVEQNKNNGSIYFDLVRVERGVTEGVYTAISFLEKQIEETEKIVIKNAYTIIAAYKNLQEGGE